LFQRVAFGNSKALTSSAFYANKISGVKERDLTNQLKRPNYDISFIDKEGECPFSTK
jgi:hypothetical protein